MPSAEEAEIELRFDHAGVSVPADRKVGTYAAAQRLLSALHLIRKPRTAAAEPAHIFVAGKPPQ